MSKLVVIGCRLPHGLVVKEAQAGVVGSQDVVVKGLLSKDALIVNGYAMTSVPEDVWGEFVRTHKDAAYLKNRMLFCTDSMEKANAETRVPESAGSTGFEPVNPNKKVAGIEVDQEHYKAAQRGAA